MNMRITFPELSTRELLDVLSASIKHDDDNKLITFLCQLSAYTVDDQLNIAFNAPSSSGKSFIPLEISKLFPAEDVIKLGYVSPTSFFHSNWVKNPDTEEYIVDLERKILIFLDQPHDMVLERLRPLLSHDEKEIRVQITDKTQKDGMRAKKIVLRGFPAVVFCTANLRIDEQEASRFMLLSPELSQGKIIEGVRSSVEKGADTDAYNDFLDLNPSRQKLRARIQAIKAYGLTAIKFEQPEKEYILSRFMEHTKIYKPRHQRDIKRIIALTKTFALLNLWTRKTFGDNLFVSHEDINSAYTLWEKISLTQELNISPYIYQVYKDIILAAFEEKSADVGQKVGVSQKEIMQKHYQVYGRAINPTLLRQQVLPMLMQAGLIAEEQDPIDKRIRLISPLSRGNSEREGGAMDRTTEKAEILSSVRSIFGEASTEVEALDV